MKYSFFCYTLISLGLLWLYSLNMRSEGLYENVTLHTGEWIGSHILGMIGAVFIIPTVLVLRKHLTASNRILVLTAVVLSFLGALSLIGQYYIDFYLVSLFNDLDVDSAYEKLNSLRSIGWIQFIFYDLVAVWVFGQVVFVALLFKMSTYPRWALGVFILAILMLVIGGNIHDLLERISYALVTIALWPIFTKWMDHPHS